MKRDKSYIIKIIILLIFGFSVLTLLKIKKNKNISKLKSTTKPKCLKSPSPVLKKQKGSPFFKISSFLKDISYNNIFFFNGMPFKMGYAILKLRKAINKEIT